ncbi:MAG: hypothetical protein V1736_09890 [Pseudomonadota bacterium]
MNPTAAKILIKVLGALAGLLGAGMMACSPSILMESGDVSMFFAVFFVLSALYLAFVGYLAWFRFSPRAIGHACGLLAFLLLLRTPETSHLTKDIRWDAALFFGYIALVLCVHGVVSRYLSNIVFPEEPKEER